MRTLIVGATGGTGLQATRQAVYGLAAALLFSANCGSVAADSSSETTVSQ